MFNLAAPPDFRGLDPHAPIEVYVRHLPHWRQDGATYFVTYRLADSLPQSKLNELRCWRHEWEQHHPPPRDDDTLDDLARQTMLRVEHWLDQGMGRCPLRESKPAGLVEKSMRHFDGQRYEVGCYVVMPNHVHMVLRPTVPRQFSLEKILQSWKTYTARQINTDLGSCDSLWEQESFDRIIRDEEHLWRAIQYIGRNPRLAGLSIETQPRWIRPEWIELGWHFES
ncbi:MAG: transposase [Planctomycetota bacterium]